MRTLFSYTPRSGSKLFVNNVDERIAVLTHGNGSTTFAGDFISIQASTAYPGNHYRHDMRSFCEQYLTQRSGFALDECGTVTLAVPTTSFAEAWAMLTRFVPQVAQDEWCHKGLFEQGAMDIWGTPLALAKADTWSACVNHRAGDGKTGCVSLVQSSGECLRVTDSKHGVQFHATDNNGIPFVTWDNDQPIDEFTPGTVISLDCSRHADRLLMAAAEYTREFEYIPSIAYSKIRVLRRMSGMVVKLINKLAGHEHLAWEEEGVFNKGRELRQAPFTVPDYKNPVTLNVDERTFLRSIVQISKTQAIVEACEKLVK